MMLVFSVVAGLTLEKCQTCGGRGWLSDRWICPTCHKSGSIWHLRNCTQSLIERTRDGLPGQT